MNYEEFEEALVEEVRHQGEVNLAIRFQMVPKNNGVEKRAMIVGDQSQGLCPTIYMDDFYDQFRKGVPIRHLARLVCHQIEKTKETDPVPKDFFADYDKIRPHIFCKLISRDRNAKLFQVVPHTDWLDLAIICYYQVDPAWIPDAVITVRKEHLKVWGITEEVLFRDAWENTERLMHPELDKLTSVLEEMGEDTQDYQTTPLYVLTNRQRCYGAVSIAYPGESERIGERLGKNYYMIPSSIHECLILPDTGYYKKADLNDMIRDINRTQLSEQDILSDHAYYYRRDSGKFDN